MFEHNEGLMIQEFLDGQEIGADDYIDLRTLDDDDRAKEAILEHSNGNMAKGFVKLCKICGGCGNDNTEFVKAAEQM